MIEQIKKLPKMESVESETEIKISGPEINKYQKTLIKLNFKKTDQNTWSRRK
jgi:translation initiation factor 2 beta subunit (eIF-2beta)/eIF-5